MPALCLTGFSYSLVTRKCELECFTTSEQAAEFVVASMKMGWEPGVPIASVTSASEPPQGPGGKFYVPVVVYIQYSSDNYERRLKNCMAHLLESC